MMAMIIHDATIAADSGRSMHYGGAIVVDGDRVAAIGTERGAAVAIRDAERIDGRGKLVLPGFANCHTHLPFTISRGIEEDFSFPSTLGLPQGIAEFLTDDELVVMAQLGALEAIRSGTTALFEIGPENRSLCRVSSSTRGCGWYWAKRRWISIAMHGSARAGVFDVRSDGRGEESTRSESATCTGNGTVRRRGGCPSRWRRTRPRHVSPSLLGQLRELAGATRHDRDDSPESVAMGGRRGEADSGDVADGVLGAQRLSPRPDWWRRTVGV